MLWCVLVAQYASSNSAGVLYNPPSEVCERSVCVEWDKEKTLRMETVLCVCMKKKSVCMCGTLSLGASPHTHTQTSSSALTIYTHSCTAHFWERLCVLSVWIRLQFVCAGTSAIFLRECVCLWRCVRSDDVSSEVRRSRKEFSIFSFSASINTATEIMDHLWGSCEGWHLEWSGSGA